MANLIYSPAADFNVQRQYLWGYAFGWWNGTSLVTPGNPSVFQEVPFGGYQVVVKFKDWFWDWDNRAGNLDYLFEDLYAIPPGGGAPIDAGDVFIQYDLDPTFNVPLLKVIPTNPEGFYWFQRFPAQNRPYWNPIVDNAPDTPFSYP